MTNNNTLFTSDNLTFIASCLIFNVASIEKVTPHPYKASFKLYHLSPKDKVKSFYKKFISDEVKVSPQELTSKIGMIRNIPIEEESYAEKNQEDQKMNIQP